MNNKFYSLMTAVVLVAGIGSGCEYSHSRMPQVIESSRELVEKSVADPVVTPAAQVDVTAELKALQDEIKALEDKLAQAQPADDSSAIDELKAAIEALKEQLAQKNEEEKPVEEVPVDEKPVDDSADNTADVPADTQNPPPPVDSTPPSVVDVTYQVRLNRVDVTFSEAIDVEFLRSEGAFSLVELELKYDLSSPVRFVEGSTIEGRIVASRTDLSKISYVFGPAIRDAKHQKFTIVGDGIRDAAGNVMSGTKSYSIDLSCKLIPAKNDFLDVERQCTAEVIDEKEAN